MKESWELYHLFHPSSTQVNVILPVDNNSFLVGFFFIHAEHLPSYFARSAHFQWVNLQIVQEIYHFICYTHGFLLGRSQHNGAILLTALIGSITEIAVHIIFTCTVLQELSCRGLFCTLSLRAALVSEIIFHSAMNKLIQGLSQQENMSVQG